MITVMKMFSLRPLQRVNLPIHIEKRLKHQVKATSIDAALSHFDTHVGQRLGEQWPSVRLALLSQPKYCAVLNRYCENYNDTLMQLAETGAFDLIGQYRPLSEHTGKYSIAKRNQHLNAEDHQNGNEFNRTVFPETGNPLTSSLSDLHSFVPAKRILSEREKLVKQDRDMYEEDVTTDTDLEGQQIKVMPSMLKAIIYGKGDVTRFAPAKRDPKSGKLSYYLMDGGSILPVLALDLQPDCSVLDLCAAPGGKTCAILQTMLPASLVCVDRSRSRLMRLNEVLRTFFPMSYTEDGLVTTVLANSIDFGHDNPNQFDRVLVDVPCNVDRHSVTEEDNNLFKQSRQGERLSIRDTQQSLLVSALKACKPGGLVVYSTCTLAPPQNDGTIRSTLEYVHAETNMKVAIVDTGHLADSYSHHFKFNEDPAFISLGQLVLPNILQNFGPTYFCKLRRIS